MKEVYHPLVEIEDADTESRWFAKRESGDFVPQPVTVRIWPSAPWISLQKEPVREKAPLCPLQIISDEEGTHIFRKCGGCEAVVFVRLSAVYFKGQHTFFEDRPETCHGCGAIFELPEKKGERTVRQEKPLTPKEK